jgi:hypothetical protein
MYMYTHVVDGAIYIYIYEYVHIYTYLTMCFHICIYIYVCIYMYTHINTGAIHSTYGNKTQIVGLNVSF